MTDNFFKGCPAVMEDARFLTDYQTSDRRNEYIKYINDIVRDDQYRLFLQLNGEAIIKRERDYNLVNNKCHANACVHNYPLRSLPRHFNQEINEHNYANSVMFGKKHYCNHMKDNHVYNCKYNHQYY